MDNLQRDDEFYEDFLDTDGYVEDVYDELGFDEDGYDVDGYEKMGVTRLVAPAQFPQLPLHKDIAT
jgi:hypothetical protein